MLDTHALLWWLTDDPKLSGAARHTIADAGNHVFVQQRQTRWEISTKQRIGKLPQTGDLIERFAFCLRMDRFEPLPIAFEHSLKAGILPRPHRDPFDRMLIAQSTLQNLHVNNS